MKLLAFLLGSAICENCIDKENDPKGLEVWFEKRRYGTRDDYFEKSSYRCHFFVENLIQVHWRCQLLQ